MLPILLYNNMEGSSSQLNNVNFGYEDGVILNCVRNRKKNIEVPNCPVCSCTIRHGELESHLALELERLNKVSIGGTKRKLSTNSTSTTPIPGSSSDVAGTEEVDVTGCTGSDVYQRVHANRLRRLRARTRRSPPPQQTGECPVCNGKFPMGRLQRHALRCLRRSGASLDGDDVPDTSSSEEGSIDVENDEPTEGGSGGAFGAEYRWCGEWRVRATALAERPPGTPLRRASNDTALVVDGDEDAELYGPPQYSPSRIAVQTDSARTSPVPGAAAAAAEPPPQAAGEAPPVENGNLESDCGKRPNGLVEASAETRIHALKMKIRELEERQSTGSVAKCLICLGPHVSPAVSIQCWHVYCEVCWLDSLRAKKICPQCNAITSAQHLRRIYM